MIPGTETVIAHVGTLLVKSQCQWVHQIMVIKKLFTKKPNSRQIHADLWEAKFMPNSCQKLAKFMPNVCPHIARLVRVHWWCGVAPFCNQCTAKWYRPYKTRYFHDCYTICARLQPKIVLCRGEYTSVACYTIVYALKHGQRRPTTTLVGEKHGKNA